MMHPKESSGISVSSGSGLCRGVCSDSGTGAGASLGVDESSDDFPPPGSEIVRALE